MGLATGEGLAKFRREHLRSKICSRLQDCPSFANDILTNGFVSDGDPVLLGGKVAPASYGDALAMCAVKGCARVSTLLTVLAQVMMAGDDNTWNTFSGLGSTQRIIVRRRR